MTGGEWGDDADLPIIDAVEPDGDGVTGSASGASWRPSRSAGGPHSSGPRLGPGKGAGIAAAALALLVIAIAAGGLSLAPEPTTTPSDTPGASLGAIGSADVSCQAPRQGQFPPVTMSSTDSRRVVDGLFAFGSGLGSTEGERGWKVPTLAAAARPAVGSRLEFRAGQQTCFHHLLIEYISTSTVPDGAVKVLLDAPASQTRTVGIELLPEGDWVVLVTAEFDNVRPAPTAGVVTVTVFRVIVGNVPVVTDPAPTGITVRPDRTPAVPCGIAIPTADLGVALAVSNGPITPGSPSGGDLAADAFIRPGDRLQIIIDGEACATGWNLTQLLVDQSEAFPFDSYSNTTDDPSIGAQNRWTVPAALSDSILTANLHFPGGLEISRYWRIIVDRFVPPPLFLVGADGTRFEASPGCTIDVNLSNGYTYDEGCPTAGYVADPDALHVAALAVIHLDMPGWFMTRWWAGCGRMSVDGLNFESPDGCSLGGGGSEDAAVVLQPPAFFLRKGDQIVQIGLAAIDDAGNSFNTTYYAHVIAR